MTEHPAADSAETTVTFTAWHEAHKVPDWLRNPTLEIRRATLDGTEIVWEFTISDTSPADDPEDGGLHLAVFEDGLAAFADIPQFFAALGSERPTHLSEVVTILHALGITDETVREAPRPSGKAQRAESDWQARRPQREPLVHAAERALLGVEVAGQFVVFDSDARVSDDEPTVAITITDPAGGPRGLGLALDSGTPYKGGHVVLRAHQECGGGLVDFATSGGAEVLAVVRAALPHFRRTSSGSELRATLGEIAEYLNTQP